MSDSLLPHGLQLTRLLCPWDFPGKSTGVGCHHQTLAITRKSHRVKDAWFQMSIPSLLVGSFISAHYLLSLRIGFLFCKMEFNIYLSTLLFCGLSEIKISTTVCRTYSSVLLTSFTNGYFATSCAQP